MVKKRRDIKVPAKISASELKKQNKKMSEDMKKFQQRQRNDFNLLFVLAINLYKIKPDHEIFTNNSFSEEFLEMIKKSAESSDKASKEDKEVKKII